MWVPFVALQDRQVAKLLLVPGGILACLFSSVAVLPSTALLIMASFTIGRRERPRTPTGVSIAMGAIVVSLGIALWPGALAARKVEEIGRTISVVPLDGRLDYEKLRKTPTEPAVSDLTQSVSKELDETENRIEYESRRRFDLAHLHERPRLMFSQMIGFGVGRMIRWRPENLLRSPLRDIRFDETFANNFSGDRGAWMAIWSLETSDQIERLHLAAQTDFLDPDSFGALTEKPFKYTGFIEHAFHYPATATTDFKVWQVDRLELVSLLKFDRPQVYVLDHLPRMDQLSSEKVPTRPLDAFESEALEQLRTAKDVAITNDGPKYRMLGSLRAAKQCLECHNVPRGELLGAFSYRLQSATRNEQTEKSR